MCLAADKRLHALDELANVCHWTREKHTVPLSEHVLLPLTSLICLHFGVFQSFQFQDEQGRVEALFFPVCAD